MPPLWSGFLDFGLDPEFFGQSGPDFAEKSGFFMKLWKGRIKYHILVCVDSVILYRNVPLKR